jgi:hypothetical protein
MTVLVVVGIALVVFGAFLLLVFPDRPGGRIGWQGLEVNSVGAGLPIVALGVAAIAFGGVRSVSSTDANASAVADAGGTETAGPAAASCFDGAGRVRTLEEGATDLLLVQPGETPGDPFWIAFTQNGDRIGGVRVRYFRDNALFKIERLVDASCRPIEPVENVTSGGDPRTLQNWDVLRLGLAGALYDLRIGAEPDVELDYFVRVRE